MMNQTFSQSHLVKGHQKREYFRPGNLEDSKAVVQTLITALPGDVATESWEEADDLQEEPCQIVEMDSRGLVYATRQSVRAGDVVELKLCMGLVRAQGIVLCWQRIASGESLVRVTLDTKSSAPLGAVRSLLSSRQN